MRAVSLARGVVGARAGAGGGRGAGTGAPDLVPISRGNGVLAAGGRGGGAMSETLIDKVARAVLYEGYLLYPYRPSVKNRQRWTFG